MGYKKCVNLLIDVVEDPSYFELDKELRSRIERELDREQEISKRKEENVY